MKRFRNLAVFLFFSIGLAIIIAGSLFNYYLSPVSMSTKEKTIIIIDGNNVDNIAQTLLDKKMIRNVKIFKIYVRIMGIKEFSEGEFELNPSMGVRKIVSYLTNNI